MSIPITFSIAQQRDIFSYYQALQTFSDVIGLKHTQSTSTRAQKARGKLLKLSPAQFYELGTDVYDELKRRIDEDQNQPDHLLPKATFHMKRNQARQKLANLSQNRFGDLVNDILFEIKRRGYDINPDINELDDQVDNNNNINNINNNNEFNLSSPISQQNEFQQQNQFPDSNMSRIDSDNLDNEQPLPPSFQQTNDNNNNSSNVSLPHSIQPSQVIPQKANIDWSSEEDNDNIEFIDEDTKSLHPVRKASTIKKNRSLLQNNNDSNLNNLDKQLENYNKDTEIIDANVIDTTDIATPKDHTDSFDYTQTPFKSNISHNKSIKINNDTESSTSPTIPSSPFIQKQVLGSPHIPKSPEFQNSSIVSGSAEFHDSSIIPGSPDVQNSSNIPKSPEFDNSPHIPISPEFQISPHIPDTPNSRVSSNTPGSPHVPIRPKKIPMVPEKDFNDLRKRFAELNNRNIELQKDLSDCKNVLLDLEKENKNLTKALEVGTKTGNSNANNIDNSNNTTMQTVNNNFKKEMLQMSTQLSELSIENETLKQKISEHELGYNNSSTSSRQNNTNITNKLFLLFQNGNSKIPEDSIRSTLKPDSLLKPDQIIIFHGLIYSLFKEIHEKKDNLEATLFKLLTEISEFLKSIFAQTMTLDNQDHILLVRSSFSHLITSIRYFAVYKDILPPITVDAAISDFAFAMCNLSTDTQSMNNQNQVNDIKDMNSTKHNYPRNSFEHAFAESKRDSMNGTPVKPLKLAQKFNAPQPIHPVSVRKTSGTNILSSVLSTNSNINSEDETQTPLGSMPHTPVDTKFNVRQHRAITPQNSEILIHHVASPSSTYHEHSSSPFTQGDISVHSNSHSSLHFDSNSVDKDNFVVADKGPRRDGPTSIDDENTVTDFIKSNEDESHDTTITTNREINSISKEDESSAVHVNAENIDENDNSIVKATTTESKGMPFEDTDGITPESYSNFDATLKSTESQSESVSTTMNLNSVNEQVESIHTKFDKSVNEPVESSQTKLEKSLNETFGIVSSSNDISESIEDENATIPHHGEYDGIDDQTKANFTNIPNLGKSEHENDAQLSEDREITANIIDGTNSNSESEFESDMNGEIHDDIYAETSPGMKAPHNSFQELIDDNLSEELVSRSSSFKSSNPFNGPIEVNSGFVDDAESDPLTKESDANIIMKSGPEESNTPGALTSNSQIESENTEYSNVVAGIDESIPTVSKSVLGSESYVETPLAMIEGESLIKTTIPTQNNNDDSQIMNISETDVSNIESSSLQGSPRSKKENKQSAFKSSFTLPINSVKDKIVQLAKSVENELTPKSSRKPSAFNDSSNSLSMSPYSELSAPAPPSKIKENLPYRNPSGAMSVSELSKKFDTSLDQNPDSKVNNFSNLEEGNAITDRQNSDATFSKDEFKEASTMNDNLELEQESNDISLSNNDNAPLAVDKNELTFPAALNEKVVQSASSVATPPIDKELSEEKNESIKDSAMLSSMPTSFTKDGPIHHNIVNEPISKKESLLPTSFEDNATATLNEFKKTSSETDKTESFNSSSIQSNALHFSAETSSDLVSKPSHTLPEFNAATSTGFENNATTMISNVAENFEQNNSTEAAQIDQNSIHSEQETDFTSSENRLVLPNPFIDASTTNLYASTVITKEKSIAESETSKNSFSGTNNYNDYKSNSRKTSNNNPFATDEKLEFANNQDVSQLLGENTQLKGTDIFNDVQENIVNSLTPDHLRTHDMNHNPREIETKELNNVPAVYNNDISSEPSFTTASADFHLGNKSIMENNSASKRFNIQKMGLKRLDSTNSAKSPVSDTDKLRTTTNKIEDEQVANIPISEEPNADFDDSFQFVPVTHNEVKTTEMLPSNIEDDDDEFQFIPLNADTRNGEITSDPPSSKKILRHDDSFDFTPSKDYEPRKVESERAMKNNDVANDLDEFTSAHEDNLDDSEGSSETSSSEGSDYNDDELEEPEFNIDDFDIQNPDNTLNDLLLYLEHQTVQVISTIQSLLTSIKEPNSTKGNLRNEANAINQVIAQMSAATSTSMNQSRNANLKKHGSWVVQSLKDCGRRMTTLCQLKSDGKFQHEEGDDDYADKQFKQRLAGLAFDVAKSTKELVKTVEEASLKEEIAYLSSKLDE